jgi:hypothetical protein
MLSVNPDAATRDDVARLASEVMHLHQQIHNAIRLLQQNEDRLNVASHLRKALQD